jgi:hypothetical protein
VRAVFPQLKTKNSNLKTMEFDSIKRRPPRPPYSSAGRNPVAVRIRNFKFEI